MEVCSVAEAHLGIICRAPSRRLRHWSRWRSRSARSDLHATVSPCRSSSFLHPSLCLFTTSTRELLARTCTSAHIPNKHRNNSNCVWDKATPGSPGFDFVLIRVHDWCVLEILGEAEKKNNRASSSNPNVSLCASVT